MNKNNNTQNSQNTNNKLGNNNNSQTKINIMDLEKLKLEYKSQLTAYKQAVTDYIGFLKNNSNPCSIYSSDSKGINQACYDKIWKHSGCTTTGFVNASSDLSKSKTLDELIYDSFLWATTTDAQHRDGCYGKDNNKYNTSTVADYDINKKTYVEVKGQTFWGNGKADSQGVYKGGDVEQCKALCSKTANCTGATFSASANGEPMCWLRTGDGEIMPALDTDYAIVPEAKKYLSAIESINKKLLETNTKIQQIVKKTEPLYNSIKLKSEAQNDDLLKNYVQLTTERQKIQQMLESYQDLDKMENQGDLKINQKYYTFVLLSIIVLGIFILLYKISGLFNTESSSSNYTSNYIQQGGELSQSTYLFVLVIIIFIILVNYFTNIKNTAISIKDGVNSIFSSFFSMIGSFFTIND
jgi:hypothetical protein